MTDIRQIKVYQEISHRDGAWRSDKPYGIVAGEEHIGGCDFEIKDKVAEPRESIKGDIGRVFLYLEKLRYKPFPI